LAEHAAGLKKQAALLPAGAERDELLKKAREAEVGSHLNDWLNSPGLRPPK
jgi:hypothetical protein